MRVWRKTVRTSSAEKWTDAVSSRVDAERFVIVERPGGRSVRIEVYLDTEAECRTLQAEFDGSVAEILPESWQPGPSTVPGKPLSIGGQLFITGRAEELDNLRSDHPAKQILCIPAAMAFGTGEHATTAMCTRLLLDIAHRRRSEPWQMLDLGTGSGILALAGKIFGARNVLGVDNDPHAVRTARENAHLNDLADRHVRFERVDLPTWPNRPQRTWPVVTANLFSELLIRLMPEIIAPTVSPGGDLVLSGVLTSQADEVLAATTQANLNLVTTKRRGRWRAFHLQKPAA